jgi:hypothetical protein
MKWSKAAAAATIAAMSVGLAACGSSSSSSSSSDTLSRGDIVSKAEAICTKAQTDAKAIPAPGDLTDPTAAAAYFDKVAPITQTETDALLALKPGDDVKADYTAFTKAQTNANDLLQTIMKKADSKDASGLDDLKKVAGVGDAVSTAAKKLGAKTCG